MMNNSQIVNTIKHMSPLHTRPATIDCGMDMVTYGDHRFIPRCIVPKRLYFVSIIRQPNKCFQNKRFELHILIKNCYYIGPKQVLVENMFLRRFSVYE